MIYKPNISVSLTHSTQVRLNENPVTGPFTPQDFFTFLQNINLLLPVPAICLCSMPFSVLFGGYFFVSGINKNNKPPIVLVYNTTENNLLKHTQGFGMSSRMYLKPFLQSKVFEKSCWLYHITRDPKQYYMPMLLQFL